MISILNDWEIQKMRIACKAASDTLKFVGSKIVPGMTTNQIDEIVRIDTLARGAICAPFGYRGFPKSVCVSVNDVVCHGVPSKLVLKDGDIVNIDVTSIVDGFHGDTSATFFVGTPSKSAKFLTKLAYEAMMIGISKIKDNVRVGDIGASIQEIVESNGCNVIKDFAGHGIGREFHMDPKILNFGKRGTGPRLFAGMCITVEPIVSLGTDEIIIDSDGWTARTVDGLSSAQFEHTVLVTQNGYEILTN